MQAPIISVLKRFFKRGFVEDTYSEDYPFDVKRLPLGHMRSFGTRHPDKIFYVIWRDRLGSGFFSNVSHVLCHLKIANDLGLVPVVDFKNFKTLYNAPHPIGGTENAWEYYFNQVSSIPLEEVYQSKYVIFCTGAYPESMGYFISTIDHLYEDTYYKYILLKTHVTDLIDKYSALVNRDVLGVHFRGQEFNMTAGHYFCPTKKQMAKYVDQIMDRHQLDAIFLVTEEQDYLNFFIARYGSRNVFYTNSFRTYGENAYNLHPRDNHRYMLGLEVLIDSYLLSKCTGLLCGESNVSEYARFINHGEFKFLYKINNGMNSINPILARYLYRIKRNLPTGLGGLYDKLEKVI